MVDEKTVDDLKEKLCASIREELNQQLSNLPKKHSSVGHVREKQLQKARRWCSRHEAEMFVRVTMSKIIGALIRAGEICPDDNTCTIKKVSPDGKVWLDVNVTVPVKEVRMEVSFE